MDNNICGFDFGTTNSAFATIDSHSKTEPKVVMIEEGKNTIPTAIYFDFDDFSVQFGRSAVEDYTAGYPGRLMRSLKSILGSNLMNEKTQIGRTSYKYSDIIGLFVKNMKIVAEAKTGHVYDSVVVGRPVYFVDNNEDADNRAEEELKKIFKQQGFKEVSFEFEPIAAAHDYEYHLQTEETCLVFDIGGGTSDFSVIELGPTRKKEADRKKHIRATSGVHIGGNDFDRRLNLNLVMPEMGLGTQSINGLPMPSSVYYSLATWHEINSLYNRKNKYVIKDLFQRASKNKFLYWAR